MSRFELALPVNPRRKYNAFKRIGDEGGMVVVPGRAQVQVLNPVGIAVYALLDGEHSLQQIVDAVTQEFEVDPEVARKDVLEFLSGLAVDGMLDGYEA